jgi:hypothetical protein
VPGKPLSIRKMIPLVLSGRKLIDRALQTQARERERRDLARSEKQMFKQASERVWMSHREKFHSLRERQAAERSHTRSNARTSPLREQSSR